MLASVCPVPSSIRSPACVRGGVQLLMGFLCMFQVRLLAMSGVSTKRARDELDDEHQYLLESDAERYRSSLSAKVVLTCCAPENGRGEGFDGFESDHLTSDGDIWCHMAKTPRGHSEFDVPCVRIDVEISGSKADPDNSESVVIAVIGSRSPHAELIESLLRKQKNVTTVVMGDEWQARLLELLDAHDTSLHFRDVQDERDVQEVKERPQKVSSTWDEASDAAVSVIKVFEATANVTTKFTRTAARKRQGLLAIRGANHGGEMATKVATFQSEHVSVSVSSSTSTVCVADVNVQVGVRHTQTTKTTTSCLLVEDRTSTGTVTVARTEEAMVAHKQSAHHTGTSAKHIRGSSLTTKKQQGQAGDSAVHAPRASSVRSKCIHVVLAPDDAASADADFLEQFESKCFSLRAKGAMVRTTVLQPMDDVDRTLAECTVPATSGVDSNRGQADMCAVAEKFDRLGHAVQTWGKFAPIQYFDPSVPELLAGALEDDHATLPFVLRLANTSALKNIAGVATPSGGHWPAKASIFLPLSLKDCAVAFGNFPGSRNRILFVAGDATERPRGKPQQNAVPSCHPDVDRRPGGAMEWLEKVTRLGLPASRAPDDASGGYGLADTRWNLVSAGWHLGLHIKCQVLMQKSALWPSKGVHQKRAEELRAQIRCLPSAGKLTQAAKTNLLDKLASAGAMCWSAAKTAYDPRMGRATSHHVLVSSSGLGVLASKNAMQQLHAATKAPTTKSLAKMAKARSSSGLEVGEMAHEPRKRLARRLSYEAPDPTKPVAWTHGEQVWDPRLGLHRSPHASEAKARRERAAAAAAEASGKSPPKKQNRSPRRKSKEITPPARGTQPRVAVASSAAAARLARRKSCVAEDLVSDE